MALKPPRVYVLVKPSAATAARDAISPLLLLVILLTTDMANEAPKVREGLRRRHKVRPGPIGEITPGLEPLTKEIFRFSPEAGRPPWPVARRPSGAQRTVPQVSPRCWRSRPRPGKPVLRPR